jgi:hypothetical protein
MGLARGTIHSTRVLGKASTASLKRCVEPPPSQFFARREDGVNCAFRFSLFLLQFEGRWWWWYRYVCAAGGVFNIVLMMGANLFGFVLGVGGTQYFAQELAAAGTVYFADDVTRACIRFLFVACACLFVTVHVRVPVGSFRWVCKILLIFFNRAGRKSYVGGYNVDVECKRMALDHYM